eukprot:c3038_g1_i1.p1 GENE.c3038_g1_i1~~c3038_g1_i1.p1  ORF type:complete len:163 (-),score=44.99 c3038_g1_i1:48-536(-)
MSEHSDSIIEVPPVPFLKKSSMPSSISSKSVLTPLTLSTSSSQVSLMSDRSHTNNDSDGSDDGTSSAVDGSEEFLLLFSVMEVRKQSRKWSLSTAANAAHSAPPNVIFFSPASRAPTFGEIMGTPRQGSIFQKPLGLPKRPSSAQHQRQRSQSERLGLDNYL